VYQIDEAAHTDLGTAPFLVGGWSSGVGPACASDDNPSLPVVERQAMGRLANCGGGTSLYDTQYASPATLHNWYLFRNAAGLPLPFPGLVVFRAHRHDAAAANCPAEDRMTCQAAIVLDSIVWRDDGGPLTSATPTS
jgi:hypothetical protein